MKRSNYIPAPALVLLSLLAIPFRVLSADTKTFQVQQVVDGNTLLLTTWEKVRLIGIDASECRVKGFAPSQRAGYAGRWAAKCHKSLCIPLNIIQEVSL